MGESITQALLDWLREQHDCVLEPGLTAAELDAAERVARLRMPPAWRAVLRAALPLSTDSRQRYPNWRDPGSAATVEQVQAPVDGVLYDVEENDFWWHAWGAIPATTAKRLAVARARLAEVPRLTPIAGHWYVGSTDDSPVFSIMQADLYVPSLTLADLPGGRSQDATDVTGWPLGRVPFWSELHAYSQHRDGAEFAHLAQGGL